MNHSQVPGANLTRRQGEPWRCSREWRKSLADGEGLLLVDFSLTPWWQDNAAAITLTAIYLARSGSLRVAVTDKTLQPTDLPPAEQYQHWVRQHTLLSVDPTQPIHLEALSIEKPWGREIWYTGVERRGVCHFGNGRDTCPIPWLQAVLGGEVAGPADRGLLLLKILEPSSQPVLGNLYFEVHRRKRELYVVTGIDRRAWADGVGMMRFGFDPRQVERYDSEDAFRHAYLQAALAYEAQRRAMDARSERGLAPDPAERERETLLREEMNRFTLARPLREGDVVSIPRKLPHALQHGVRVVEFQTPEYERMILSFDQKAFTQNHWDTREAVSIMDLTAPPVTPPLILQDGYPVRVERLGAFPEFEVFRVTFESGGEWLWDSSDSYSLLLVVSGQLSVGGLSFTADQAALIPRGWRGLLGSGEGAGTVQVLLASPLS